METLSQSTAATKNLTHKICSLAVEIQGAMERHEDEAIWQDLLNLLFSFISEEVEIKVDAALQIFNGLFSYIMDHLVKYAADLKGILEKTFDHQSVDIKLAALQCASNYLQIAEKKDTKAFLPLLPKMVLVVTAALKADEETVLEDALVEFNELAEIEPSFFKPHFKEIYAELKPIIDYSDFANNSIRHQPLEFVVTVIERLPSVVKKDQELLVDILERIFKLMIEIDEDIDESWLRPKEGFVQEGDDEEEDNVNFGKGCVDRLVSGIGEEIMLPLIGQLVSHNIQNDSDWRYKHASIMAFSQVGEYVDDSSKIAQMIPILIQHLSHNNPKIRYATLHCLGQIADDMPEEFQKAYHATVLPALVIALDDQVPRVQAHACAALTNFMEGATEEIVVPYLQQLSQKFCSLIQSGISLVKENAATALASTVEQGKTAFVPYFKETLQFLIGFLNEFHTPEYKQFRGQVIEAITIISAAVGEEEFAPVASDVISVMLNIQNTQLESKDAQRIYLLSAWQRICLLMKASFAPYLKDILPSIFTMATLNPEMGISGQDQLADLTDVLTEVNPTHTDGTASAKMNVVTDELEEKDVAIQMLAVFIDELGSAFADYVEPTSKILLALTSYTANDNIRSSCAQALPSLLKSVKQVNGITPELHVIAKLYNENLINAMKLETETEVIITQVQSLREIIDEAGEGLLNQDEVKFLSDKSVFMVEQSLERIDQNNKIKEEEAEDEDDQLDDDDLNLIKEENQNEYDLQISAAELMGTLFKTHKDKVADLVVTLRTKLLFEAFKSNEQKRLKFALFILDDMVEHLGPSYFSPEDYSQIVQTVCSYTGSQSASLRQASAYGVGVIASNRGEAFVQYADSCLAALKLSIEFAMTPKVQGKKSKIQQYHHARDNAIASVGKVIKHHTNYVVNNPNLNQQLVQYWVGLLPITHDIEEAQANYEFLSDFIATVPELIFGADPAAAAQQLAKIYAEAFETKYHGENGQYKLKFAQTVQYLIDSAPAPVPEAFKATCQNVLSEAQRAKIEEAYAFKG